MKYRKLGNTGERVSALSFGASSLGSVFRDTDEQTSIRAVHAALDCGINYMDVAPYYGMTKAETVLGKALGEVARDRYLLSTKAGRYGPDEFDFSAGRIRSSLDESLKRLGVDYVDMLFLHDVEFVPESVVVEEAMPTLLELKKEGKIRWAGFSGLPLKLFERLLPQTKADAVLSYCHYSLNDTSLLSLLPLLEKHGAALVNASPLSMGLLGPNGAPDWHPASDAIKAACKRAADYCLAQGANLAKLAVQYSLAESRIPTTLVSTANPDNVVRNVQWLEEPLDEELLRTVLDMLEPIHDLTWPSGREEYQGAGKAQSASDGGLR